MRKPRSDSKLLNLPEEQQAQLVDWLLGGMALHGARELVSKEFGVSVSLSALSQFYQAAVAPHLLRRRGRAVATANEVAEAAQSTPGRFDAATIDALKQRAFEMAIAPMTKPGDVKAFFMLLQKNRDQELKAESLKLDREKFEFDAAKAALEALPALQQIARTPGLDEREKIDRVRRQLFGVLPEETGK